METIQQLLDNITEAGYTLDYVWEAKSPELKDEIVNFWLNAGALSERQQAVQRVDQVALLIRDVAGEIAAVSTVVAQYNQQLGHQCYYFRCFVKLEHRRLSMATILCVQVYDYFNQKFEQGHNKQIIGLITEIQNQHLQEVHVQAIRPVSGLVYIGKNQRGELVRVRYFDGALI